jgi:hypothetical protein
MRMPAAATAAVAEGAERKRAQGVAREAIAARVRNFSAIAAAEEAGWWATYGALGDSQLSLWLGETTSGALLLGALLVCVFGALLYAQRRWRARRLHTAISSSSSWWSTATDTCKRVDFAHSALASGGGHHGHGIAASGFVDVSEAASAPELVELISALAEELADAPLSEHALLLCVDAGGHEKAFVADDDLEIARLAVALRVVGRRRSKPSSLSKGGSQGIRTTSRSPTRHLGGAV